MTRLRRAAVLLGGSLLAAAWVIVPLLAQRPWAAVNEPLQGSGLVNGYGAHQVLDWLVSGQLLDAGRLPVVTVLAAVGFAWRGSPGPRTPTPAPCWPRSRCACCSRSAARRSGRSST